MGGLRAASRWSAPKASRLDQKALCLKEEQARPKPSYEGETKTPPWGAVAASRWSAPNASKPDQRTLRLSKIRQEQNQNLPMSENQKHRHGGPARPPVGRRRKHLKSSPKGTNPQPLNPLRFQDHLVLETKPHFRIIIRLENARPALNPGTRK